MRLCHRLADGEAPRQDTQDTHESAARERRRASQQPITGEWQALRASRFVMGVLGVLGVVGVVARHQSRATASRLSMNQ
jgi:hypothetical protein